MMPMMQLTIHVLYCADFFYAVQIFNWCLYNANCPH